MPEPAELRPTRARYWVIVFAIILAVIQYIDRVCISQAAPAISEDLGLTPKQMGYIFSAFTLAYALFEIPTGWLGDKIGARKVLIRVVLWWSFFTAATGWMWNHLSMVVTRFLFGAGEAGCFPNLTKALSAWLPTRDRTRAQALMWMGARWGGAAAPLLVVAVMSFTSWRVAFSIFALLGLGWAVVFSLWFRDNPRAHPGVNAAELALLQENEKQYRRPRQRSLAKIGEPPGPVVARGAVFLPQLRLVFLRHVAADVSQRHPRTGDQDPTP